ncbi:hypothetical protein AB0L80_41260 [Streptomyces sp. NPDC052069]
MVLNCRRRSGTGPRSLTGKNGSTSGHSASERSPRATLDNYQVQAARH